MFKKPISPEYSLFHIRSDRRSFNPTTTYVPNIAPGTLRNSQFGHAVVSIPQILYACNIVFLKLFWSESQTKQKKYDGLSGPLSFHTTAMSDPILALGCSIIPGPQIIDAIGEPGGVEVNDLDDEWVSYAYEFTMAAEEGSTLRSCI
ncbi:hypothetical protein B0H10DRAFT_1947015 [Mycena sp. CBHHK59/15]|nr:hypothetical protein B0H10DRAFT_1947015 [Mycena sp. CBHHK59/15]